ncbi:MAG: hypothetical protein PHR92_10605 [Lachnospiraceae bacterium]|nr:hypothetical protein [Lachnospiraceae bacterium]
MKRTKVFISTFLFMIVFNIAAFAGTSYSASKYFTQDGVQYSNQAKITAGGGYVQGTVTINRHGGTAASANTIGAQAKVYKSTGALLALTGQLYNKVNVTWFSISTNNRAVKEACYCEGTTYVKKAGVSFSYGTNRTSTLKATSYQDIMRIKGFTSDTEGRTYGSILGIAEEIDYPDFIKVVGASDLKGYVKREDLITAMQKTVRSAIPVYNGLGESIIDSFVIEMGVIETDKSQLN